MSLILKEKHTLESFLVISGDEMWVKPLRILGGKDVKDDDEKVYKFRFLNVYLPQMREFIELVKNDKIANTRDVYAVKKKYNESIVKYFEEKGNLFVRYVNEEGKDMYIEDYKEKSFLVRNVNDDNVKKVLFKLGGKEIFVSNPEIVMFSLWRKKMISEFLELLSKNRLEDIDINKLIKENPYNAVVSKIKIPNINMETLIDIEGDICKITKIVHCENGEIKHIRVSYDGQNIIVYKFKDSFVTILDSEAVEAKIVSD